MTRCQVTKVSQKKKKKDSETKLLYFLGRARMIKSFRIFKRIQDNLILSRLYKYYYYTSKCRITELVHWKDKVKIKFIKMFKVRKKIMTAVKKKLTTWQRVSQKSNVTKEFYN